MDTYQTNHRKVLSYLRLFVSKRVKETKRFVVLTKKYMDRGMDD